MQNYSNLSDSSQSDEKKKIKLYLEAAKNTLIESEKLIEELIKINSNFTEKDKK